MPFTAGGCAKPTSQGKPDECDVAREGDCSTGQHSCQLPYLVVTASSCSPDSGSENIPHEPKNTNYNSVSTVKTTTSMVKINRYNNICVIILSILAYIIKQLTV